MQRSAGSAYTIITNCESYLLFFQQYVWVQEFRQTHLNQLLKCGGHWEQRKKKDIRGIKPIDNIPHMSKFKAKTKQSRLHNFDFQFHDSLSKPKRNCNLGPFFLFCAYLISPLAICFPYSAEFKPLQSRAPKGDYIRLLSVIHTRATALRVVNHPIRILFDLLKFIL